MFASGKTKEGFATATFPNDPGSVATNSIQQYFSNTLPNVIFTQDKNLDINSLSLTKNTRPSGKSSSIKNYTVKTNISANSANTRQSQCEATGNGDQFDHLVSLAASQDGRSKTRCGWTYNKENPANGRGAYGTIDGPLLPTTATGTWMWNLQEAKEKYHKSICDKVAGCADIDSSIYGGRCGWNNKAGKAIPIQNGQVAYPYSPTLNCASADLITKAASCPSPNAKIVLNDDGKPVQVQSPAAGPCTPLPNGSLSRDCLIQRVISAGCSDEGTLAYALKAGSDTNYIDNLSQTNAYKTYQERAVLGLDSTSLKNGKLAASKALDEFKRVNDHATSTQNGALEFASRDLCFKRGELDEFDFCSELTSSSPGPFPLDCIQKAFLKAGGQKTGTSYPKDATPWNNYAKSWSDVGRVIQSIVNRLSSSNRAEQEAATKEFYGIALESRSAAPIPPYNAVKFIEIKGDGQALQLSQVIGYDMNGNNVTVGRPTTASPPLCSDCPSSNAVDGDESAKNHPGSYHSVNHINPFFRIELDSPVRLSYIRIYNRKDCCQFRLASFNVLLLDANRNVVWSNPLNGEMVQTIVVGPPPSSAPVSMFQDFFNKAGCTRVLSEDDMGPSSWWRKQTWNTVLNDMTEYGRLTATCTASKSQIDWCSPGKKC